MADVSITKAGSPQRASFPVHQTQLGEGGEGGSGNGNGSEGGNGNGGNGNQNTNTGNPGQVDEAAVKAYLAQQGISFETIDELKSKLSPGNTQGNGNSGGSNDLTEEQKKAAAEARERAMIDEHLSLKGTVEQYTLFKEVIAADKQQLGLQREIKDLTDLGFSQEDAIKLAKQRYFQLTDEEIAAIENEDEKKVATKQREAGASKLQRKGSYIQNNATQYFEQLSKNIEGRETERKLMEQHTSKVEDAISKFVRKEQLKLGKIDDQDVDPIDDFEFSDTALASAKEVLVDQKKFEEQLFTKDGEVNLEFILPHLVRSFSMTEAVKKSYLTGVDRQVKFFRSKFGDTIPPLGGNNGARTQTGKVLTAGKPVHMQPGKK